MELEKLKPKMATDLCIIKIDERCGDVMLSAQPQILSPGSPGQVEPVGLRLCDIFFFPPREVGRGVSW